MGGRSRTTPFQAPWSTRNARADQSVIVQEKPLYCGCACIAMVLRTLGIDPPSQDELFMLKGTDYPYTTPELARVLTDLSDGLLWKGDPVTARFEPTEMSLQQVMTAMRQHAPWIAMMWETFDSIGHFVVVDAATEHEVLVRDPRGQLYAIPMDDFLADTNSWNGLSAFVTRSSGGGI